MVSLVSRHDHSVDILALVVQLSCSWQDYTSVLVGCKEERLVKANEAFFCRCGSTEAESKHPSVPWFFTASERCQGFTVLAARSGLDTLARCYGIGVVVPMGCLRCLVVIRGCKGAVEDCPLTSCLDGAVLSTVGLYKRVVCSHLCNTRFLRFEFAGLVIAGKRKCGSSDTALYYQFDNLRTC